MISLYTIVSLFVCFYHPISALSCYDCVSTFPGNNVCLPACSQTNQSDSTCLLVRNIPLEDNFIGSVRAGHLSSEPIISDAAEKYFIYGEEAVYQNPSAAVNWDWEYGPITYGCDTPGCNDPQNVNRLPNALNARIPNETLSRLLTGDLDSSCYVCNICLDEDATMTDMSGCGFTACPQHSCNFVAVRSSTMGASQCDGGWHFTSGCILSKEPAQVDMNIMYYIGSKTTILYQMEATCLSDNCNNFTTFKQLKDAITVDPDLTCLPDPGSTSTPYSSTTTSNGPTTSGGPTTSSGPTTSGGPTTSTTTRSSTSASSSTTSIGTGTTTTTTGGGTSSTTRTTSAMTATTTSSGEQMFMNMKMFTLILLSFYIIKF